MMTYEVQVFERVPNKVDAKLMGKMTAEQLHELKPFAFKHRRDLSCSAEAATPTDAKVLGKSVVESRLSQLQPPTRMLSCAVLAHSENAPARIKIIVEKVSARR